MPSRIRVSRTDESDLKLRTIEVLLDGKLIADLYFGNEVEVEVEPGFHELSASNKLKTATLGFEIRADETLRFQTKAAVMGCLLGAVTAAFGTMAFKVELRGV